MSKVERETPTPHAPISILDLRELVRSIGAILFEIADLLPEQIGLTARRRQALLDARHVSGPLIAAPQLDKFDFDDFDLVTAALGWPRGELVRRAYTRSTEAGYVFRPFGLAGIQEFRRQSGRSWVADKPGYAGPRDGTPFTN